MTLDYKQLYNMWSARLIEYEMSIFEWNGLSFPQRELECVLISNGLAAMDIKDDRHVYVASPYNPGQNYGTWLNVVCTAVGVSKQMPTYGVILIRNNEIGESSMTRIEKYATLLTHADLTLQAALINLRKNGTITVPNDQTAKSVSEWYRKLTEGKLAAIVDKQSMESIIDTAKTQLLGSVSGDNASLTDCCNVTNRILQQYFAEIGIKMANEKKEREIVDEVAANDDMLMYNIDSMLKNRKHAAKRMSEIFQTDITVNTNARKGIVDNDR